MSTISIILLVLFNNIVSNIVPIIVIFFAQPQNNFGFLRTIQRTLLITDNVTWQYVQNIPSIDGKSLSTVRFSTEARYARTRRSRDLAAITMKKMAPLTSTKDYVLFYFKKVEGENFRWKCSCGCTRKCDVKKNGYSNLFGHITLQHQDYAEVYRLAFSSDGDGTPRLPHATLDYMIDAKSTMYFKWAEWIIMDEHELIFVEKELTRRNSTLEKISVKTLKSICFKLATTVEERMKKKFNGLPFCLVFDCWSEDSTHFMGLFISYPGVRADSPPELDLLAFAPMLDETSFTVDVQKTFVLNTLAWYDIDSDAVDSS